MCFSLHFPFCSLTHYLFIFVYLFFLLKTDGRFHPCHGLMPGSIMSRKTTLKGRFCPLKVHIGTSLNGHLNQWNVFCTTAIKLIFWRVHWIQWYFVHKVLNLIKHRLWAKCTESIKIATNPSLNALKAYLLSYLASILSKYICVTLI